ncbi:unnamed protein product [Sphenostylis stenocarpa]|uniref:Uncharacterized protein n=1 Tax=Sphenostylis stenocarpa TaxID=92480 RepID=A0AA86VHB4_9FABA|nr:unnamed protein product [Sphenostylis stenocarpa]
MEACQFQDLSHIYAWLTKETEEFTVDFLSCRKLAEFGDLVKQPSRLASCNDFRINYLHTFKFTNMKQQS